MPLDCHYSHPNDIDRIAHIHDHLTITAKEFTTTIIDFASSLNGDCPACITLPYIHTFLPLHRKWWLGEGGEPSLSYSYRAEG